MGEEKRPERADEARRDGEEHDADAEQVRVREDDAADMEGHSSRGEDGEDPLGGKDNAPGRWRHSDALLKREVQPLVGAMDALRRPAS